MRTARAALALLLCFAVPVRAEITTDPLWYLLSTYVLATDTKAVEADGTGPADAKGLAALQADLLVLTDGFEGFRDEAQVKETLDRLKPRMSPELRPFFKDRSSSLDAIYRTLAVTDYTWAQRFPDPPCGPVEARRKLLDSRDGLFQTEKGEASPWLVSLLGTEAMGKSAEQALDQASSQAKLTGAEYEKLRARARKLTLALASDKAVGAARSRLYCARAAAFSDLAAFHRVKDAGLISASRAVALKTEESVFVVVWKDRRAAATLLHTKSGAILVTDAAVVADTDHPKLFAYSKSARTVELAATVVRRHPQLSVAALAYAEDQPRPALALAENAPAKDDLVAAVGHTSVSGLWTKTSGLVTKIGEDSFQTDAAISPELSGGPVLNAAGEVTGILVLRSADTEEGRWPVAIPAPVLARWLDDPAFALSGAPVTEQIEDWGTAAVLSRARPSALTEAGLGDWHIPNLPPPPSAPRGVCVQNCGGGSSSASSYSGSYSNNGSAELGQALGELGAVLILKGVPALFRGIGKLFKGNGSSSGTAYNRPAPRPEPKQKPKEPPPPPPLPRCEFRTLSAPATAGEDPFEIAVQLSCDDPKVRLSGYPVNFSVSEDGGTPTQAPVVFTDERGIARLSIQIINDEVAVHKVKTTAERFHDDLDRYSREIDPPVDMPQESEGQTASAAPDPDSPAPIPASNDFGLTEAANPTTVPKAATATAVVKKARDISKARNLYRITRSVRTIRVVGALGSVASGGVSLAASMVVSEVVFALGEKALNSQEANQDEQEPAWVVRAGIATPELLKEGAKVHFAVPGLTGFSVQSAPRKTIKELAAAGQFPNAQISVTTVGALLAVGVHIVKSPGKGYHHTAVTEVPLTSLHAEAISAVFMQQPNPAQVKK